MNIIDFIVVIILAYALINGFIKGFILEIAGMIALVLGLIGAFKFSSMLGNYLAVYVAWSPKTIQTVSFISALSLQQAQHVLLGRVGLCQHGGGRLLQDLVFR